MDKSTSQVPDAQARIDVLDGNHSYIVQAPAGSGKTSLLIQRLLVLLAQVDKPEEILAITFTRKAAEEMRTRLIEALQQAQGPEPTKEYEKQTWRLAKKVLERDAEKGWDLLKAKGRLRLKTIDSFCSYLIRCLPTSSHFGAPLETEADITPLFREAVRALLSAIDSNGADSQAYKSYYNVLRQHNNNKDQLIANLIAALQARPLWRDNSQAWLLPLWESGSQAENKLQTNLTQAVRNYFTPQLTKLAACLSKCEWVSDMAEFMVFACQNLAEQDTLLARDLRYCQEVGEFICPQQPTLADLPYFRALKTLLLTDGNVRKTVDKNYGFPSDKKHPEYAQRKKAYIQLLGEICYENNNKERFLADEELQQAFDQASCLNTNLPADNGQDDAYAYTPAQLLYLRDCAYLLELALHFMREAFRANGVCDFAEIAMNSLEALKQNQGHNELTAQMDAQIKHILFDEYQDTSNSQLELLEYLTAGWQSVDNDPGAEQEGRTIFIVGDPMQSIYRFREAEVGVFLRTRDQGLAKSGIRPLPKELTSNFRSVTPLIRSFNTLFGGNSNNYQEWQAGGDGIFPTQDSLTTSAITYKLADSPTSELSILPVATEELSAAPATPPIFLHKVAPQEGTDNKELEAQAVLELTKEWYERPDKRTLAILLRARSGVSAIISKLRENKIPYQAHDIELLTDSVAVNSLTALTRALLHLGDRIAWLALLRSPLLGLNDDEVTRLLEGYALHQGRNVKADRKQQSASTVWDILNAVDFTQPIWQGVDVDDLANRCQRFTHAMRVALKVRGIQPLSAWIQGAWLSLGGPRTINKIQEQSLVSEYFSLLKELEGECLPDAEELQHQLEGRFAAPNAYPEGTKAVQIMTMHSAKGLEFDTVILPYLNSKGKADTAGFLRCEKICWGDGDRNQALFFNCPDVLPDDNSPHANSSDKAVEDQAVNVASILYKDIAKCCSDNEKRRLLYVATTRAKDELHLVYLCEKKSDQQDKVEANSLWKLLADKIGNVIEVEANPDGEQCPDAVASSTVGTTASTADAPSTTADGMSSATDTTSQPPSANTPCRTLPPMPPILRLKKEVLDAWQAPEPVLHLPPRPNYTYDDKSAYGIALHLLCQYIGERNEALLDKDGNLVRQASGYSDYLALAVAEYSKNNQEGTAEELAELPRKLQTGLQGLLADPYGRWSLQDHTDSSCEQDICVLAKDEASGREIAKTYRLDRIFTDAQGQFWIVDYKTGDPKNANTYHAKMKLYAQLIAKTKKLGTVHLALVYVDSENPGVQLFCGQYNATNDAVDWDDASLGNVKYMPQL